MRRWRREGSAEADAAGTGDKGCPLLLCLSHIGQAAFGQKPMMPQGLWPDDERGHHGEHL